jgi:enamine deaminase RidA (YjgF/YER057c/UK114 family)
VLVPIVDRLTSVPEVAPGPGYAHAVTASGKLAFVSGQIALDADGQLVGPGDLAAQTAQALRNLHLILGALGADWPDVVRFTWYVRDAGSVPVIRGVREQFLRPSLGDLPNPASTLVQVAALARPEFLVEVDAVVAVPD